MTGTTTKKRTRRRAARATGRLLVDADILVYAVCSDLTEESRDEDDVWTYRMPERAAVEEAAARVESLLAETRCSSAALCVGSKSNWRKRIDRSYKSNRVGKRKPLGYFAVIERLRETHDVHQLEWLEADDVLGIMHTADPRERTVIASNDKDMLTLPGEIYNPATGETTVVGPLEANLNHLAQTLTGDPTDGYPGCPGIGEVRARRALEGARSVREAWRVVVDLFAKAGLTEERALLQARLARILRTGEYVDGEVLLWTP